MGNKTFEIALAYVEKRKTRVCDVEQRTVVWTGLPKLVINFTDLFCIFRGQKHLSRFRDECFPNFQASFSPFEWSNFAHLDLVKNSFPVSLLLYSIVKGYYFSFQKYF